MVQMYDLRVTDRQHNLQLMDMMARERQDDGKMFDTGERKAVRRIPKP